MSHMPYHHCSDFRSDDGVCNVCGDDQHCYEDDDVEVQCNTCNYSINPYEERVHVWNIFNEEYPSGHQIFLCTRCHKKRKGR